MWGQSDDKPDELQRLDFASEAKRVFQYLVVGPFSARLLVLLTPPALGHIGRDAHEGDALHALLPHRIQRLHFKKRFEG